ncbi:MAG TPA: hypothetical protein VMF87_07985 [Streptosporangiaceae bacterium]|nr:hypothetical protein [Streptosporangiaceae bacterium]
MNNDLRNLPEARQIAEDFPGWEAWASLIGKQWHARLIGATPPVMLHDDSPADLAEQIRRYVAAH